MIVAIHQPNFLPWLGFFDKMRRADVFILLDDVQYSKGSWINRVRIADHGVPRWISVPVRRATDGASIREVRIGQVSNWRRKALAAFRQAYAKSPGFRATWPLVEDVIGHETDSLYELNIMGIRALAGELGVQVRMVLQSETGVTGKGNELLARLVRAVGGDTYIYGGGSAGYQDDRVFSVAGIECLPQEFVQHAYAPAEFYIPGMSAVDYLMWRKSGEAEE